MDILMSTGEGKGLVCEGVRVCGVRVCGVCVPH